jgi:hypothetical protein
MRRSLLLLALTLAAGSCLSLDDPAAPTVSINLDLSRTELNPGESMRITIVASNVSGKPVTLSARSDCLFFFLVRGEGGRLHYDSTQFCSGAAVTSTIQPGEQRTAVFDWDGRSASGGRVPAGAYDVRGGASVAGSAQLGAGIIVQVF